jgi:DNA-binding CsgD family transcriptional regulator
MTTADSLHRGREAYVRRAWAEARREFDLALAATESALPPDDLERLANAAYLTGSDRSRDDALERAHLGYLAAGDVTGAVRCAFWLGMGLIQRTEHARGGGWFARAGRLVEEHGTEGPAAGYVIIPSALQRMEDDPATAAADFRRVSAIADGTDDRDLTALGRLGLGQSLLRQGEIARGTALLDEVMLAVEADEISPVPAGIIYCAVIDACQAILDLRRAREWTDALVDWCASQPDLVPYRGQCLVHRVEILQHGGAWDEAIEEAQRACERFQHAPEQPAIGSAYYRLAELRRLRGEHDEAERCYRLASRCGYPTEPGLVLLRLAQGRHGDAAASIGRALAERQRPAVRAGVLAAAVSVALQVDDVADARRNADELAALAATLPAPALGAMTDQVDGEVLLAEGHTEGALTTLRRAAAAWRELGAPYEAARARELVGRACLRLGDNDGASLELESARTTYELLAAAPDLSRLRRTAESASPAPVGGLTGREREVLRLVAHGRSNRAIAEELVISEHTVARHVQNIFAKLELRSRTAAAAFAYEHDLV